MRAFRIAMVLLVVALASLGALFWATQPSISAGDLLVPAKTNFTKGRFSVYVQPWGGELVTLTRPWSRHADKIVIDLKRFPANTRITWRWPPIEPKNGPGVWGYDQISHGNYDGGPTEEVVAPVRVKDLKALQQTFGWSINNRFGEANVLSEFYLRSSITDVEAKQLEIGWLFHMPPSSRRFFDSSQLVGQYTDENNRVWMVRIADKYCMFAPKKAGDVSSGNIDMLRALKWLQSKGKVSGDEWLWGIAIGVEPVRGVGNFTLNQWHVTRD